MTTITPIIWHTVCQDKMMKQVREGYLENYCFGCLFFFKAFDSFASLTSFFETFTKLSKILTDFAEEIIDISVVDHLDMIEQQEVNEKTALYTQKLNANGGKIVRDNSTEIPALDNLTMRQITDQIQNSDIRWDVIVVVLQDFMFGCLVTVTGL